MDVLAAQIGSRIRLKDGYAYKNFSRFRGDGPHSCAYGTLLGLKRSRDGKVYLKVKKDLNAQEQIMSPNFWEVCVEEFECGGGI